MTDDEVLRFYNGIVVATSNQPRLYIAEEAWFARKWLGSAMDALAAQGMVATVGHRGCAVIREIG